MVIPMMYYNNKLYYYYDGLFSYIKYIIKLNLYLLHQITLFNFMLILLYINFN